MISSLGSTSSYSSLLTSRVGGMMSSSSSSGQAMQASAPPPPPPPPPTGASGGMEAKSLFDALAENDDADGDGLLSAEEIANSPVADLLSSRFSSIDSDSDGLLSEEEITSAEQSSRGGASGMGEMPPPPPPPAGGAEAKSLFDALAENDDADGDGLLSAEEIANSPVADLLSSQFSSIDSDGDGLLSEDEITSAEQSSRGGASGMGEMPPPPPPAEAAAATDEAGSDPASVYESLFNLLSDWQENAASQSDMDELAQRFMDALKQAA